MTHNTITLSELDDLAALLDAACQTIRKVRLQSQAGDMGPVEAVAIIKETAETISTFCKVPSVPARYFTDRVNIWRFDDGVPMHRMIGDKEWMESAFIDLDEFQEDMNGVTEITEEEGEP